MVELIVVIVIVLVLSAVLVPMVLKYIAKAQLANCKADAATILVQLQADGADFVAAGKGNITEMTNGRTYYVNGVLILGGKPQNAQKDWAMFQADAENEITAFGYSDGKYTAIWNRVDSENAGWTITEN